MQQSVHCAVPPLQVDHEAAAEDSGKWDSSEQHWLTVPLHQCSHVVSISSKVLFVAKEVTYSRMDLLHGHIFFFPNRERANQVKRNKQQLLEQIQSRHFQEWERDRDPETHCYDTDWPSQLPFFSPELDSRNHKPTGVWLQVFLIIEPDDCNRVKLA